MIKNTVKTQRSKTNHNKFIRKNVKNYINYSTPSELRFDILVPFFIAIVVTLAAALIIPSPRDFATMILELNGITITITAILAGFNTASLAIIASVSDESSVTSLSETVPSESNPIPKPELKGLKKIKNLIMNNPSKKEWDAVISFFAYAVISQLLILIFSLMINVLLTSVLKIKVLLSSFEAGLKFWLLVPFSSIWIFLILHSIFLSIRNIDMISHFVKFNSKQ